MSEWKQYTLTQMGLLQRGKSRHRPRYAYHLYGGPYPFVQTGEVKAASKYIDSFTQTYSEAGLAQSRLWPKDTLCITIAANIADIAILKIDACFPDSILGFTPDKSKCDVDFAFYTLKHFQREIQAQAIGTVQDNINLGTFEIIKFPFPELPEQEAIAELLSSLDDKIDLLHRNNNTLEQLAETLFRQWLGSSQAEKTGRLAELIVVHDNKRIPLSSREREKRKDGTLYPYYGAASIMDYINDYIFDGDYILLGEDGTVQTEDGFPIIQRAMGKFWVNNHTHVLTSKTPVSINFLEILLKFTSVSHIVTGAVQPKINQGNLMNLEVPIPSSAYMEIFSQTVDPLLEKRNKNILQIKVLSTLRDNLLSKIMSGEVRVNLNQTT